jgi:nicotinamide mononucleotide transporter
MLDSAFHLFGTDVSWLEVLGFVAALGCVILSVFEIHWGWLLAIISSILYGYLFSTSRLYGEAALQGFFVLVAAWGWWQWLFGRRRRTAQGGNSRLTIESLGARHRLAVLGTWLAGWLILGLTLEQLTDSDLPWLDAFPTAGSLIGQLLLARKLIENWAVWTVVNLASVVLFVMKGLWLTALLYLLFAMLAILGWLRWSRQSAPAADDAHQLL